METLIQIQKLNELASYGVGFLIGASLLSFFMFLTLFLLWLGIDKDLKNEIDNTHR